MNLYKIVFVLFSVVMMHKSVNAHDTFLFSFEREGKKSYLIGTNHGLDPARLPSVLMDFLLERSVLVVENKDTQKPLDKNSAFAMGILKEANEPDYVGMLSEKDRAELLNYVEPTLYAKGGHIEAHQLNLKGLYAAYIQGHFLNGLEYWLMNSFTQAQKEIQGLETIQEVSIFFPDVTWDAFEQIVKNKDGFDSVEAEQMDNDYLLGIIQDDHELETNEELLQRNSQWLEKIINYHVFYGEKMVIAVGFYHLFNAIGLCNLLMREGFTLKRMKTTGEFVDFK